MFKQYKGLWALLAVALVAFAAVSFMEEPPTLFGHKLKQAKFAEVLTAEEEAEAVAADTICRAQKEAAKKAAEPDTMPKTILFFGDSMLDGLSPRMAAYAKFNGHKLYSVIWYSSTTEVWGTRDKLRSYIAEVKPDYIFVSLGGNELFVKDIKEKRAKYVDQILKDIGNIPFVWIGPPNWKPDTGINDLVAGKIGNDHFFLSNGMKFERKKDGAHPTNASSAVWLDSVMRWMPRHAAHPIKMNMPPADMKARPERIFLHQPSEI